MNVHVDDALFAQFRRRLADELTKDGDLRTPAWRRAVETVPRELFLGERVYRRIDDQRGTVWEPVTAADAGEQWADLAYENTTWVTQLDGYDAPIPAEPVAGEPTSSSTLPGLVVGMLEDLRVEDGQKVLEMGTGTGYSTGLMCERLSSGLVTSIEVDPHVAARARDALQRAGYAPTLVVGDGLEGYAEGGPYDRIIATCSVRAIPAAWLSQAPQGGVILATLSGWLHGSALARLTVTGPGKAEGAFLPGTVSFMPARPHAAPPIGDLPPKDGAEQRDAVFGGGVLTQWTPRWIAQLAAPGAQQVAVSTDGGPLAYCVIDQTASSWAWLVPEPDGWTVRQGGRLRLWDEVEAALIAWHDAGAPEQREFRLRIGGGEQIVFLPGVPALRWVLQA